MCSVVLLGYRTADRTVSSSKKSTIYTCLCKMLITNLHYMRTAQILGITATNKLINRKMSIKYIAIYQKNKPVC